MDEQQIMRHINQLSDRLIAQEHQTREIFNQLNGVDVKAIAQFCNTVS